MLIVQMPSVFKLILDEEFAEKRKHLLNENIIIKDETNAEQSCPRIETYKLQWLHQSE